MTTNKTIADLLSSARDVDWRERDRQYVTAYCACCYGDDGSQPGDVSVYVCPVDVSYGCPDCGGTGDSEAKRQAMTGHPNYETLEDEGFFACPACEGEGELTEELWGVLDSDECSGGDRYDVYRARGEAVTAAEELAEEMDETPDLEETIEAILAAGWFDGSTDADDVRALCEEATGHSQGYLLVTRSVPRPTGLMWTTNGYLQCRHLTLDATHEQVEYAACSLLAAVQGVDDEEEDGEDDE